MKQFDREFKSVQRLAGCWMVVSGIVGIGVTAVVVWAIIKLVTHFTH